MRKIVAGLAIGVLACMTCLTGCDSGNGESGDGQAEAMSLTFTTTYNQTETAGLMIQHFVDQLNELSDGAISVDVYWGGTLSQTGEELDFVGSGAADMTLIGQATYADKLALLNFPSQVLGGYEEACDLMDTIAFDNADTSALVSAQVEGNNVKMLTSLAAGSNAFVAKEAYTSLADMAGKKLGVGMQQSAFESLGFNVVTVMPWDYYDNLSRGIADIGYMSTSGLVSMKIQEVTPYFMADGTYTAGNFITINLDKWNAMSDANKEIFQKAADNTQAYSIELLSNADKEAGETIAAAGGSLITLPEADCKKIQEALFDISLTDARANASNAGCGDDMETILKVVAEKTGNTLK